MKSIYTFVILLGLGMRLSAQMLCYFNPNTGAIYHNSSLAIYDITCGDFNGDEHLDVVTANSTGGNISFIPGDGAGHLGSAVTATVPSVLFCIASGDFNGDQKLDVVTANHGSVFVLLGNGNGTFQPETAYAGGASPSRIFCKDIDSDSILDIVEAGSSGIHVFLGMGNGQFTSGVNWPTGGAVRDVAIADFDGDSLLDFVATTSLSWTVSVLSFLKGDGNGAFDAPVQIAVPHHSIFGIKADDLDHNGTQDLVVSNLNNMVHRIEIYLGDGQGGFAAPVFYPAFHNPNYVYLADMDGNSTTDIVVPDGSGYCVLTGRGDGTLDPYQYFVAAASPNGLCIGDFNEDSLMDLVSPDGTMGYLTVSLHCAAVGIDSPLDPISLFPNPAQSAVMISLTLPAANTQIQILDACGRSLDTINFQGQQVRVARGDLPSGLYYFRIYADGILVGVRRVILE